MQINFPQKIEKPIVEEELRLFWQQYVDNTGWLNLDQLSYEIPKIKEKSTYIKNNCEVFIVVGIGGSYLGGRAVIEALGSYFGENNPKIYYAGHSLSSEYLKDLEDEIKDKEIIVNYISKTGKTLESKIIFNYLYQLMRKKYEKKELQKRIIYTVGDPSLAEECDFFIIPNNIEGRFSVLTPVGLLPMAVAGIDIEKLILGAKKADLKTAQEYALYRRMMENKGNIIEAFVVYEPKLFYLLEWLKQLFAESLGKENGGIIPIGLINTTDLHSFGQYLQAGRPNIMETVLSFDNKAPIMISEYNRMLHEINNIAKDATIVAHKERIPNLEIKMGDLKEEALGEFLQFMMLACAIGGFLQGVNPFDQKGVEDYKREMQNRLKN